MQFGNLTELIGNTPIIELTRMDTGKCRLFAKLENRNPGGSIKDRIGLSMINAAEKEGKIKKGDTIIEATAGNTGIGLVAILSGYKIKLVIPDKMSTEKINHLRAIGAEIILTRSDVCKGHPEYYQDLALRISKETGAFYINQFENLSNPLAHQMTTAPEIWEQMNHSLDVIVAGIGSGGTIAGLSDYFKKVYPALEIILADPEGSILAEYVRTGKISQDAGTWLVEGVGEDFIPTICDFSLVKKAYSVSDRESFRAAKELLRKEGILGGSSTGTLISAALKYCKEQTVAKKVLTFVCDTGDKYLSKMYNDNWLVINGLSERKQYGDLRDIIIHRYKDNISMVVNPDTTLNNICKKIRLFNISYVPVLSENKITGLISQTDILSALSLRNNNIKAADIMSNKFSTVNICETVGKVLNILKTEDVCIAVDNENIFQGLLSKADMINYLLHYEK